MQKPSKIINILMFPAKTKVFCLALLWLIVLLILGTIAQKDMGLYLAHQQYFSAWVLWVFDVFPTPAAFTTMGFIFYGLLIKTFSEKWTKKKIGTLIIHLGVLLLIFGGFLTSKFSIEGNMALAEGGESNFISSYHNIELAVTNIANDTNQDIAVFPQEVLQSGNIIKHDELGFSIKIQNFCNNCAISINDNESLTMPERIILSQAPPEKIEEENISGVRFIIEGSEDSQDGRYLAIENIPPITKIISGDKIYQFSIRHKRTYLPFSLKLIDFEKKLHSGTNMAKSYKSDVILSDNNIEWSSIIEMNQPLRYKGYTFYQSSVLQFNGEEMSVFAVVKNIGRLFPYISSIIICLGLLTHLFVRLPLLINKQKITALFLLFSIIISSNIQPAIAKEIEPQHSILSQLPVMHDGRIKPLDTFARIWLISFSGHEKLNDMPAISWLLELVLNPEQAHERQVFNIANPDVIHALKLKTKQKHLYSFNELFPAMRENMLTIKELYQRDEKDNSVAQRQLIEIVSKIGAYVDISNSLSIEKPSYLLRIIPPQWSNNDEWYSPWEVINKGQGSPKAALFMDKWTELTLVYKNDDIQNQRNISNAIIEQSYVLAGANINKTSLKFEQLYNNINFFKHSLILYISSLLVLIFGFMTFKKPTYIASAVLLIAGALLHIIGLGLRMYIMNRPPVSTLYESIVFVGLISIIFALIIESRSKNSLGLLMGSMIGSVLQFIGMKYSADGDSMSMLAAVLDTNFWLATHVVTITIGYGCAIIGSILGHGYLLAKIISPTNKEQHNIIMRNMMGAALVALFFSVLGTILGGIWADQSWGRFWGWDPKENGAMLICLWLILLLHGVITKLLSSKLFAISMVITNIIVVLAWFGVNLLNVGLHSYGFTENIAQNIILFCSIEIIFIIFCSILLKIKKKETTLDA